MALSSDADSVGSNDSPPLIAVEFQAPPHDSTCDPSNPSQADASDRDAVQEPEPDVEPQDEGTLFKERRQKTEITRKLNS